LFLGDQSPAKTVSFGLGLSLDLKARRADSSVKLVMEAWINGSMHGCTKIKAKSRGMNGLLSISVIMSTVHKRERERERERDRILINCIIIYIKLYKLDLGDYFPQKIITTQIPLLTVNINEKTGR
jgi:hypothetical protein